MSHATLAQDHRTITPLAARRAAVTAFVAVDERFSRVRTARVILMVAVAGIAGGFLASLDPLALLRLARRAELRLGGAAYFDYPGIEYQRHLYDCGPAALVMLLRLSSMAAPPVEQVSRDTRTSPRGTRLEDERPQGDPHDEQHRRQGVPVATPAALQPDADRQQGEGG